MDRYRYRYQGLSSRTGRSRRTVVQKSSRRIPRSVVHRRHALHITVVLSKAAHSGPSVCLRARAPAHSRILSRSGSRLKLCSEPAGESVQVELQVFALPYPLGYKTTPSLSVNGNNPKAPARSICESACGPSKKHQCKTSQCI